MEKLENPKKDQNSSMETELWMEKLVETINQLIEKVNELTENQKNS